ncbi:MAG: hypothetical protein ACTSQ8_25905 [Candidatus Helarchaeota archaeon]
MKKIVEGLYLVLILICAFVFLTCGSNKGDKNSSPKCPNIEGTYNCITTLAENTCSWAKDPIGTQYNSTLDIKQNECNLTINEDGVSYKGNIDSEGNFSWSSILYITVDNCIYEINSFWEGKVSGAENLTGTITNTLLPYSGDCINYQECKILESFIAEP